jgi:hypothetical protein
MARPPRAPRTAGTHVEPANQPAACLLALAVLQRDLLPVARRRGASPEIATVDARNRQNLRPAGAQNLINLVDTLETRDLAGAAKVGSQQIPVSSKNSIFPRKNPQGVM